ncbi:MAG: DUF6443 domain-containing protein [Bacteroidota bacterium]
MKKYIIYILVFLPLWGMAQIGPDGSQLPTPTGCNKKTFWRDKDNDGWGNPFDTMCRYTAPSGYITPSFQKIDCDDNDPNIQKDKVWYQDVDGDGYGNSSVTTRSCKKPSGYTEKPGDCNDSNKDVYLTTTWYQDADGDGWGDSNSTKNSCNQPSGYVANNRDCNDSDRTIYPRHSEPCNGDGIDNNCNGTIDENSPRTPSLLSITNECGRTVLTQNDRFTHHRWYWQSDPNGTSMANDSKTISLTSGNVYYLRAYDTHTECWSIAKTIHYTIDYPATPTMPTIKKNCGTTIITRATPPSNTTWYWQNSPTATSTSNASASVSYTANGTVYLRGRSNTGCWGDARKVNYTTTQPTPWYADNDNDGLGDPNTMVMDCSQPTGYVNNKGDRCPDEYGERNGCIFTPHEPVTTTNKNYTYTEVYQVPVTAHDQIKYNHQVASSITYYDGLGRTQQQAAIKASPNEKDIISHIVYDQLGKVTKSYLPYEASSDTHSFRGNAIDEIKTFYNTPQYENTTNPYTQTIYEHSPLNRAKEVAAPGETWKHIEGEIQYEDPVYTYFPKTVSYEKFWEAQDIFYIEGERNLPSQYTSNGTLMLNNFVNVKIENGTLTIGILTTAPNNGTHKLPLGKLRLLPISSEIKNIDLGVLKDAEGNPTDYRLGIKDNYITITPTRSNPRPVSKGIQQAFDKKITYDLTQIQYVTYQNVYRSKPDSHTIKSGYGLNTAAEVLRFDVVMLNGDSKKPSLVPNGNYPANQLSKSIVKNENWKKTDGKNNTAESFTDKSGRVVLSRTYNNQVAHDTYNVYDDFGNLTFVIPPKVNPADGISAIEMDELIYQYRYDQRNRIIEKKTPGKGWEYIVYNELDQPVMTQDQLLKGKSQWLFIKYDRLGRVAYTGTTLNGSTRKVIQHRVNTGDYPLFESKSDTPSTIAGATVYYTKTTYPTTIHKVNTINYYDNYTFDIPTALENPGTVYGTSITNNTKTLPTASKIRVLGTNQWTTTVTYYDKKARAVYAASKNDYLSTTNIIETQIDFVGKVIQSKTTHTKTGNTPIVTIDSFTYDHQGRVLTQTQKINEQDPVLIAANSYDKLGQVKAVEVGGTSTTLSTQGSLNGAKGLQTIDYKYNIRGWLKSINEGTTDNGDLFGFEIKYMDPNQNLGANGLYNGNISEVTWKTANDHIKRGYGYQYDNLSRITQATSTDNGRYTLSNITYDKMGNILTLNRQGHTNAGATTFGEMDKLAYTYNEGNKLLQVTDTAHKNFGFKDGTNTANDYEYDLNGNMTIDRNKGITNIKYNHLDLPLEITFDNSSSKKINYVYDATGNKLKKTVTDGSKVTITEYAGGAQYKNGTLEFIPHAGGYIEPINSTPSGAKEYQYVYQYTDHLGNPRLSYADRDNSGTITNDEIIEENNYYPFGLQQKGYNTAITGRKHNYKYNNTELEEGLGLNWYEMPLRSYDPTIARWNRLDPVIHHSLSTYNAFDNNPVFFADPSGGDSNRSHRGGHMARMQRMNDRWGGIEYSNLDYQMGRANSHPAARPDNNNGGGSGTNYGSGLAGLDNAMTALGFTPVTYTLTPITDPKKRKVTMMTEDPVAYGTDGGYDEMPDWIDTMDVGHYETSFEGTIEEYNEEHGTDYEYGDYGKWYYDNHYAPELSALRGSIQAAQAEAAEYVSYILPTPAIIGNVARGAMTLGKIGKALSNTAARKVVLKLAKPHPFLYSFSTKTLRPGQGQFDAGHRAAAFLHKEIIMNGSIKFRSIFNRRKAGVIFNYTTKEGQRFSEIINPYTRKIFHQAPNHIRK